LLKYLRDIPDGGLAMGALPLDLVGKIECGPFYEVKQFRAEVRKAVFQKPVKGSGTDAW
jgi:hypothetical protein